MLVDINELGNYYYILILLAKVELQSNRNFNNFRHSRIEAESQHCNHCFSET